jgi:hypothetical protein
LGLECDKLDKAALDSHFDAFIGALLREIGPRKTSVTGLSPPGSTGSSSTVTNISLGPVFGPG